MEQIAALEMMDDVTALVLTHRCLAATASAQARHVTGNLLKEQLFKLLCSSSLLSSLALDPSIELPIERAFAHLCCVTVPLLIEFITTHKARDITRHSERID